MSGARLILASASPRRRALLEQISILPDAVIPADIDETPQRGELPARYAERICREKAAKVSKDNRSDVVLAGDTVVACGRRILPKTEDSEEARRCLELISGRAHRVFTGICLRGPEDAERFRVVETRVKVRRLHSRDIDAYLASEEWRGKAGGYAIQGRFAAHIVSIIGSYTNVVGLPLYETANLLNGAGWGREGP